MTQRRFAVMGKSLFQIVNKLATNQTLCRLIEYDTIDPLNPEAPDVNGDKLINKKILAVPKLPDTSRDSQNYVVAMISKIDINENNLDFKRIRYRLVVACPYDLWLINADAPRPYLMMSEIDQMLNEQKVAGLGNLKFDNAGPLTLSPQLAGIEMYYEISQFN